MAERSNISWTDATFNPWIGCQAIGPGCDNCYAEAMAKRMGREFAARTRTSAANWKLPIKWDAQEFVECDSCGWRGELREASIVSAPGESMCRCPACDKQALRATRRRVFCASMADVFDNKVPTQWRVDLLRVVAATPNLDWQFLTKRIGNAHAMMADAFCSGWADHGFAWDRWASHFKNVWIGATICNQEEADRDIPKLLSVPARVRFLSVEPMLGRVDVSRWLDRCDRGSRPGPGGAGGVMCTECNGYGHGCTRLRWVIVGGESGGKRRPMQIEWARDLIRQCKDAGVPVFVKQDNGLRPGMQGRFTDDEFAIKEFPA